MLIFLLCASLSLAATVTVKPSMPTIDDELTCLINGQLNDDDSYVYSWQRASGTRWETVFSGAGLNTLGAGSFNAGESIRCNVVQEYLVYSPIGFRVEFRQIGTSNEVVIQEEAVVDENHLPVVQIIQPRNNDYFIEGSEVNFRAGATDEDGDELTFEWAFGDGAQSNELNTVHEYATSGNYNVVLTVSDGHGETSASVSILVLGYAFDITNLNSYANDKFRLEKHDFFRGEPIYVGFSVVERGTTRKVPNLNIEAYLYNFETGEGRVNLLPFSETTDLLGSLLNHLPGNEVISDGQLYKYKGFRMVATGDYFYYLPEVPKEDELLGRNTILVIAFRDTEGGQGTLFVNIFNNPLRLQDIPDMVIERGETREIELNNYVEDYETEDRDITWSVEGNENLMVEIENNVAIITAPESNFVGQETLVFTVDDNDGSTDSDIVRVLVVPSREDALRYRGLGKNYDFEFSRIISLRGSAEYKPGEKVDILYKITNKGVFTENLHVDVYVQKLNAQINPQSLIVANGETKWNRLRFYIPVDAEKGQYLAKFTAVNKKGDQIVKYWKFEVV